MAQLPVRSNWRGRDKSRRVTIKQRSDEALGAMQVFWPSRADFWRAVIPFRVGVG